MNKVHIRADEFEFAGDLLGNVRAEVNKEFQVQGLNHVAGDTAAGSLSLEGSKAVLELNVGGLDQLKNSFTPPHCNGRGIHEEGIPFNLHQLKERRKLADDQFEYFADNRLRVVEFGLCHERSVTGKIGKNQEPAFSLTFHGRPRRELLNHAAMIILQRDLEVK